MKDLDEFSKDFIIRSRNNRDDYLASNKQCCFNCKHHTFPANPEHASNYVTCEWIKNVSLPEHLNFGKTYYLALQPFTAGKNCETWEKQ